jgi:amidase
MDEPPAFPLNAPLTAETMVRRIKALNPRLHAVRDSRTPDASKAHHVLVKNNIGLAGFPTSAGSKFLEHLELPDAFCVRCLKEAGVDVFGTAHMTELAGFVTTAVLTRGYSYLGGFPVNPSDPALSPGGSSNGSAIAVKAGMCDAALGTETRGSVMIPALACRVYAFKPTRGRISRSGIIPLSSLLDAPGVLARSPETLEKLLPILFKADPEDPASGSVPKPEYKPDAPLNVPRIGLLEIENESKQLPALLRSEELLNKLGFETVRIPAQRQDFAYKRISSADFLLSMGRFLAPLKTQLGFGTASELIERYRREADARPYGFDRLEDALRFPPMTEDELHRFAAPHIQAARETIGRLLQEYRCSALAACSFIDYWSISGAPSAVVPLQDLENRPLSLMIGGCSGGDQELLRLIKEISSRLENLNLQESFGK